MPSCPSSIHTATEIPQPISEPKKHPDQQVTEFDQFPEGGTAAWCAVLGGALVQFCGFGYASSFGVYQAFYTLHYLTNDTPSIISWIGSINGFTTCIVGLLAGMLYDRGYFYYLLIGGSLLQSFTLFMLSLAKPDQYYQILLAQGIGLGMAQGLVYVPTIAVVSHYFRRRRTLAMSLVAAGSSLGSITHPIMLNYLFNRGVGFANGVRISAGFVSVLLLTACLLARTRLESPKQPVNYVSIGGGIVRDIPFCLMSVGCMIFQIPFNFPVFYLQLDSIKHGHSNTFSFYSLALMNGASLIGRLSAGFIASRIGVPNLLIISTTTCGILILGMIGLSGIPSIVVLGTTYGFFSGIYIALLLPLMALLTSDLSEFSARMGVGITFAGFGNLVGGPIAGMLLTSKYNWWKVTLFDGLISFLACGFLIAMEFMRRRKYLAEDQAPKA